MYALHPDQAAEVVEDGLPFRTLLPGETGGSVAIYLMSVSQANHHKHEHEDQIYIIQSGQGLMRIGDEQQEVGPGWLVFIPRGQMHSLEPLQAEPVRLYSIVHTLE